MAGLDYPFKVQQQYLIGQIFNQCGKIFVADEFRQYHSVRNPGREHHVKRQAAPPKLFHKGKDIPIIISPVHIQNHHIVRIQQRNRLRGIKDVQVI